MLDSQIKAAVKSSFFPPIEAAGRNKANSRKEALSGGSPHLCHHSVGLLQCTLCRGWWDAAHLLTEALHWLPVQFRIHFKIFLFAFKSLDGLAPAIPLRAATLQLVHSGQLISRSWWCLKVGSCFHCCIS